MNQKHLYKTVKTAKIHNHTYYQGKPCRNGHTGIRYTNCNRCVKCMSKRYKRIKIATPSWTTPLDIVAIHNLYDIAAKLSELTGIQFSVDHIYPLLGKTVSGLHTPANLTIMPHEENMRKKNQHPNTFYETDNF